MDPSLCKKYKHPSPLTFIFGNPLSRESIELLQLEGRELTNAREEAERKLREEVETKILRDLERKYQEAEKKLREEFEIKALQDKPHHPTPPETETPPEAKLKEEDEPTIALQQRQGTGTEEINYKPVIELLGNFQPENTCVECVRSLGEETIPHLDKVIEGVVEWREGFKFRSNPFGLDDNEIAALGFYTWDIRFSFGGQQDGNFFYILNRMLCERNFQKMSEWRGYLYYLQMALSKIPDTACTVYRGISAAGVDVIRSEYVVGRPVHWSSYSSTTPNLHTAKSFANENGKKGVILQIEVINGKEIQNYSAIPGEREILLSPNMKFFVSKGYHTEGGQCWVHLVQVTGKTFVF